jgi:hypothetical protein
VFFKKPSHYREWALGLEEMPFIAINNNLVEISNVRDFDWMYNTEETEPHYIDKKFLLSDIEGVDVIISHFTENKDIAHTFLIFNIKDDDPIGISVETRREVGEDYNVFLGAMRNYELIYVVATYDDIVRLRTDVRHEEVYRYPTIASASKAQELFADISKDINELYKKPAFYNTITRNCTGTLAKNIEKLAGINFPFLYKTIQPGKMHQAIYEMKLVDFDGSLEEMKAKYLLTNN